MPRALTGAECFLGVVDFIGRLPMNHFVPMGSSLWRPVLGLLLLQNAVLAVEGEPNPVQPRTMQCRFEGGAWRSSRVVDYGSAIELEHPDGSSMTYHFAVDTAPPFGGVAVDNQGSRWAIAKQPSPYQLSFRKASSGRTIECHS